MCPPADPSGGVRRAFTDGVILVGVRTAYALNATLAWIGIVLNLVGTVFFGRPPTEVDPGLYGSVPGGPWMRVFDVFSYFTIWSVTVVALSTTMLAFDPRKDSRVRRALRLSGLLMIVITAIVYAVLLAPVTPLEGWSVVSNPWVHILVPVVTVVVWLVWGPRGWIRPRIVVASLVVPVVWVGYALARGAIEGLYPYGFLNVGARGYPAVMITVVVILAVGVAIAAVLGLVDAALIRTRRSRRPEEVSRG